MIYLTFFCTITLFILLLITLIDEKKKSKKINIDLNKKEDSPSFLNRILYPSFKKWKRDFRKKISGEKQKKIEVKLLQAGNPFGMTPVDFRLLQITLSIFLPITFGILGTLLSMKLKFIILFVLLGIVLAFFLPHLYLVQKTKERTRKAIKELPDVVDLLTVSLEAGLGFDLALHKLVSRTNGILCNEFHRCLEEIRLGKPRRESLKEITTRLVIEELNILISSILQAEKLGISMVRILRIQSNEIRNKRKQRAEEQAMKAPIKMLFPLVFFIFPTLFIVLLGPAIIQFVTIFKN
ncbi:type II secretion system F family protein [Lutibacter sp. B2]|nr:type II secretion system F family protein [Lutibacter sp. B2]